MGWTTHFNYYHYNSPICKVPIAIGNYSKVSAQEGCSEGGIIKDPPTNEDWIKVLAEMKELEDKGSTSSSEYYNLLELQEEILLYFVKQNLSENNVEQALQYLMKVNSEFSQLAQYGILMNKGSYNQAEVILKLLDNSIPEMSDFKAIQYINLDRLRNLENYKLSSKDQAYLESIAKSDMGVKAYARTILALLRGIEYLDEYRTDKPIGPELHKLSSTNSNSDFKISPNPTTGNFNVLIPKELSNTTLKLYIMDLTGKVIVQKLINGEDYFDISGLESGIYLVKITNKSLGIEYSSKLIKQ